MKTLKTLSLLSIIFIVLGIIYSRPLISNFNSSLPYTHSPARAFEKTQLTQGDHLQLFYSLWLFKDYFISEGQRFFNDPYQFTVKDFPRPYTTRELPLSIMFLLFSFFGNVTAYNCLIVLSFVLCGICMYLLTDKYFSSFPAALVSSVIFTLAPFRLAQLFGGHPNGFLVFWVPLVIYLYEQLWDKKKWTYGWLSGICVFLMAIQEPHLVYFTSLFTIVFWGYKFMFKKDIKTLIPIGISWLFTAFYMLYIKRSIMGGSVAGAGRGFAEIRLFAPSIVHIFQRVNPVNEKYIYLGLAASALFVLSIFYKLKFLSKKENFPYLFYFFVFIFTLILSLGPNLKYLPIYKICYKLIPFFHFPRSPARIIIFTFLSLSLLAGYGVKKILTKRGFLLTTTIIFLICIDFRTYHRIGLTKVPVENSVYQYIKDSHPNTPILELPIWPGEAAWASIYEYYTTLYQIPMINGYSAFVARDYVDKIFWPLVSINMGILTKEQYELLKSLGVKYILLHKEAYPAKVSPFPSNTAIENLKLNPYVRFIMDDKTIYLFTVLDKPIDRPTAAYTIPSRTGLFYECEHLSHRMGRLVEDKTASQETSLFVDEPLSKPVHFVFGPWKLFPPGRYKVIYRLRGTAQITIEVTAEQGTKRIIHLDIPPDKPAGEFNDYELNLTLDKTTRLEFRIIYYGEGRLWADYIYFICREEEDPRWFYEAEDLYYIGKEIDDADASNNTAVYLDPRLELAIDITIGPYRRYPAGRYKIGFRLKIPELTDKPVCRLKATWAQSDRIIAERTLSGIEFSSVNIYEYHYITINLLQPTVLEFKVEFAKETPLYVDCIKIEPPVI